MNFEEFAKEVESLPNFFKNRDLEIYLLTIYRDLNDNREKYIKIKPTFDFFLEIFKNAFSEKPALFDENWLKISKSPSADILSRKFTNFNIKIANKDFKEHIVDFEFTIEVLKFQISELHKMKNKELKDKYRYFGIDSPSGNRWYNFDPFTNLSCGVRCMKDNEDINNPIDWSFIGKLLEDGRVYE